MRNIVVAAVLLDLTAMDDGNVNLVNMDSVRSRTTAHPIHVNMTGFVPRTGRISIVNVRQPVT